MSSKKKEFFSCFAATRRNPASTQHLIFLHSCDRWQSSSWLKMFSSVTRILLLPALEIVTSESRWRKLPLSAPLLCVRLITDGLIFATALLRQSFCRNGAVFRKTSIKWRRECSVTFIRSNTSGCVFDAQERCSGENDPHGFCLAWAPLIMNAVKREEANPRKMDANIFRVSYGYGVEYTVYCRTQRALTDLVLVLPPHCFYFLLKYWLRRLCFIIFVSTY